MVARIFIDGEAGTTGLEIRDRLARRRDIELISISDAHRKVVSARRDMLNAADVAILCLPDEAAKESVALIDNPDTKVIDASSAHRIDPDWAYGFAEMTRDQGAVIAASKRVANPGCYPQGVIACVRPLIESGLLPADYPFTVNAISGYSGGGRKMIEDYEAMPAGDVVPWIPYALGFNHKHLPEMGAYAAMSADPLFQPAVGGFRQGMVTMVPLQLGSVPAAVTGKALHDALKGWFDPLSGFVEVADYAPLETVPDLDPRTLNGTNAMRLFVFANDARRQVVLAAVYDNLGKGASGAAVQNLNLMLGCDARASLVEEAA